MKNKILFSILCLLFTDIALAGIKNEQQLFGGVLTRAGVTGRQPLNRQEMQSLCEKGYTEGFFMYGGAGSQVVSCSKGTFRYQSPGDFRSPENVNRILENIHKGFTTGERTFVHCNNGAHATGFIASLALRTFCGISGEEAVQYWDRSLGGYPLQEPNRSGLMKRLRNYPVRQDLELSAADKARLGCPK